MESPLVFPSKPMDRHDSGAISGATDESPFGSGLTTPVDEVARPFLHLDSEAFMHTTPKATFIKSQERFITPKPGVLYDALAKIEPTKEIPSSISLRTLSNESYGSSTDSRSPILDQDDTHRGSSLYSIPNHSIAVTKKDFAVEEIQSDSLPIGLSLSNMSVCGTDIPDSPSVYTPSIVSRDDLAQTPASASIGVLDTDAVLELETKALYYAVLEDDFAPIDASFKSALKLICFLPWCALVGAAILLAPLSLEPVAFVPGYLKPPSGIRRFAHWTECVVPHVAIFLASIAALCWWNIFVGFPITACVVGQFIIAWQDFKFDSGVALGSDDRQSIYLVAKEYLCGEVYDGLKFQKRGEGYYVGNTDMEAEANSHDDD